METFILILIFILLPVLLIFIAIKSKENTERLQKEKLTNAVKYSYEKLEKLTDDRNRIYESWKQVKSFFDQNLGEPTTYFGVNCYEGKLPWELPLLQIDTEDILDKNKSLEQQLKEIENCIGLVKLYAVPNPYDCIFFFQEKKIVYMNLSIFTPADITGVKITHDKDLESYVVAVSCSDLKNPVVRLYFEEYEEDTADDLVAAVKAFMKLK